MRCAPEVTDVTDVTDVTNVTNVTDVTDATDVTDVTDVRGVVDALRTRGDLLATDEDVVAVRPLGVDRVGHRVEGAQRGGELVDRVEVGPLLLAHHDPQQLLVARRQVLILRVPRHRREVLLHVDHQLLELARLLVLARRHRRRELFVELRQLPRADGGTVGAEQLRGLVVAHAQRRAGETEVLERVLRAHRLDLGLATAARYVTVCNGM